RLYVRKGIAPCGKYNQSCQRQPRNGGSVKNAASVFFVGFPGVRVSGKATLNEQETETLEKLKDALTEQSSFCECEGFINGFRLGVRLMVESFYGRE
ncbi:MAG: hypothetical protein UH734_05195, partial [Ruminococcus sp.]|nr:hypothetical protein [Ruminococcus sp.]